jgi:hypothetical protein
MCRPNRRLRSVASAQARAEWCSTMKTKNPILWRELIYQQRAVPRSLQILDSVGIVIVAVALAGVLLWLLFDGFQVAGANYYPTNIFDIMKWGQVMVWVIHALAAIRAIISGADVVRRGAGATNWDELRLAGISPSRLLLGKWWAAFYRVRGWMVALGIIQLTLVGVLLGYTLLDLYGRQIIECLHQATKNGNLYYSAGYSCSLDKNAIFRLWQARSPISILGGAGIAVALSVAEMITSTAVGVTSGLLLRRHSASLLCGLCVRFFPVICFTLWPNDYWPGSPLPPLWAWRWYNYSWFALADGGTTGLMRIVSMSAVLYGIRPAEAAGLALVVSFGMLTLLFIGAMLTGWLVLNHNGFSSRLGRQTCPDAPPNAAE